MFYRVVQVYYYLFPRLSLEDSNKRLEQLLFLSVEEKELFLTQQIQDQAHCWRLYDRLAQHNVPEFVLWAVLFHDIGKGNGYGLLARVLGIS
jgi:hypothetical protein